MLIITMILRLSINVFFIAAIALITPMVFANQLGLPPLSIPHDNPQTSEKINLGRKLFHDTRFSADRTVSCATCHQPDKAFTDGLTVAKGINHLPGPRNTPTVINAAFYTRFFLDGRRESLESQALDPILNPIEHGLSEAQIIVEKIRNDPSYLQQFRRVFEVNPDNISIEHVAKAIASYERTLISGNSPFDQYFFGGIKTALSTSAARGLNIFRRKANCANCHEISWDNALFTDNRFYNIGIGYQQIEPVLETYLAGLQSNPESGDSKVTVLSNRQRSELGRFSVSRITADIGNFRTPTLRNIALTGPYMHDGSLKTLEEVIDYYNRGGNPNPYLDPAIFPLRLTVEEKTDLAAFLHALSSPKLPY